MLFRVQLQFPIRAPGAIQSVVQQLGSLRRFTSPNTSDDRFVQELIARLWRGDCGALSAKDLTDEYGVICSASDEDRERELRNHILVEGVVRGMQMGTEASRRWALHRLEVRSGIHCLSLTT